jgi:hypothetical protein
MRDATAVLATCSSEMREHRPAGQVSLVCQKEVPTHTQGNKNYPDERKKDGTNGV